MAQSAIFVRALFFPGKVSGERARCLLRACMLLSTILKAFCFRERRASLERPTALPGSASDEAILQNHTPGVARLVPEWFNSFLRDHLSGLGAGKIARCIRGEIVESFYR